MIQGDVVEKELLDSLDIPEMMTVCFVCTGNTCRSPMAAALFNHLARGRGMRAFSAGIHAVPGAAIADNALEALKQAGVADTPDNHYTAHMARNITAGMMEAADRVIGMTAGHALALIGAFPQYAGKISAFRKDLSDPYGGDLALYQKCLEQIKDELQSAFPALAQDGGGAGFYDDTH